MSPDRVHGSASTVPHPDLLEYYPGSAARRRFVDGLFDRAAPHYAWINRFLSLGSGTWYRKDALRRAGVGPGMAVLDVATGNGVVAGAARKLVGASGRVIGADASLGMLREARKRLAAYPATQGLAEELPLAGGSVDAVSMGYALRHVRDLEETFREYHRVLRPGGVLLVLELSRPPRGTFTYSAVRFYLKTLMPGLARLGGKDAEVMMRYFWDTIESCVPPESILTALAAAGFQQPQRQVLFNVFSEFTARKAE